MHVAHIAAGLGGERYDLVVLDPPWENASAKRASRYPTLPSRNLLAIPMRRVLRAVRRGNTKTLYFLLNCALQHYKFLRCAELAFMQPICRVSWDAGRSNAL